MEYEIEMCSLLKNIVRTITIVLRDIVTGFDEQIYVNHVSSAGARKLII